jgi:PAS domain S-box-containing protein
MKTPPPPKESASLEALQKYQLLDNEPEATFDDLAHLAANICQTPIALINLTDRRRQWFNSQANWDLQETPGDLSFCSLCTAQRDVVMISDTLTDERSAANPSVTSYPYVRFYAGVPLVTQEGGVLGALCVLDRVPRQLNPEQVEALRTLSRQIATQIELRRHLAALVCITNEIERTQETRRDRQVEAQLAVETAQKLDRSRDITEYQQLEVDSLKKARREEARFFALSLDLFCIAGFDGYFKRLLNPAWEKTLGYTREELLSKPFVELVHPEDRAATLAELEKLKAGNPSIHFENRYGALDNSYKWLSWTAFPVVETGLIYAIARDITEKKQLEKQFFRTQRLESLGTLASGIAHDLNNILTPILAAAQLLQMKFPHTDERTQQLLKTLETNSRRGAALVKQVLSFARGVEGKRTILQVRHLISEVSQIASQTFPKSIEVSTDIISELWTVFGDVTQLHQVLMNLAINARDAMPNGGILKISAANIAIDEHYARMNIEARIGHFIVIEVADTGIGIPPEIIERIFEPFFTTKELGKGTGIGLSTVMEIVKNHGGFVKVSSQVGKGSQFQVYLPAAEETEPPLTENLQLLQGRGELILIVDDEAPIREITKTLLEINNYQALTASDGIEAIALYIQHQKEIAAVLVDLIVPVMDGATTIRTLQKINPQIKIIAINGVAGGDRLHQELEVEAFLSKPYTAKDLLESLHQILSERSN